jgi:hypothetical protein
LLWCGSFASAQVMIDGIQYSNLKAAFDAIMLVRIKAYQCRDYRQYN